MEQKLDGVKINVSNETEGEIKNEAKPDNIAIKRKQAAKKKESSAPAKKPGNGSKNGLGKTLTAVILTALVVGGGIYAWQKATSQKNVDKIKDEVQSTRLDFEQRLASLKDNLTNKEKENEQLKTSSEQLKITEELLAKAKIEYKNDELGLSFEYPASLGQVELTVAGGSQGKIVKGVFSKTDKIFFSGVSADYLASSTAATGTISFLETTGFLEKDKKFYFQYPGEKDSTIFEIQPDKLINNNNNKVLLITKKSFTAVKDGKTVDIGENIGAVTNLKGKSIGGVAFMNQDLGVLPMAEFEKLLSSIIVK